MIINLFTVLYFIGHAHITDFNIAATLHGKKLSSSLSGTKPYIGNKEKKLFILYLLYIMFFYLFLFSL